MPRKGKDVLGFRFKNKIPTHHGFLHSDSDSDSDSDSAATVSLCRRSFDSESRIKQPIESATEIIMKWSMEVSACGENRSMFCENKQEALRFIKCVNDLQKVMRLIVASGNPAGDEKLIFSHNLMQTAIKRLEMEFYRIISVKHECLDEESCSARVHVASPGDSISEMKTISSVAMADLRTIADCMISSGYAKECVKIYRVVRKSIVDEGIYHLGVVKFPYRVRKMDSEVLDFRIENWLKAVNIAIGKILYAERILCDHVFATSESIRESCFTDTCKDAAMLLFSFPETIVKCKKSKRNVFHLLDMFTTISDKWSEIESIFSFESTEPIRLQALTSHNLLAESICAMLSDFSLSIKKHSSNSLPVDGGVHTLALQSMDYLSLLAEYREVLSVIFTQYGPPPVSSLPDSSFNSSNSSDSPTPIVSSCIAWLVLALLCKLDHKARKYKDIAVSYLFLANNVQHVLLKTHSSKIRYLLGDGWIAQHESKLNHYIDSYKRLAWGKVFSSLPENPTASLSTAEVIMIYRNFNSTFKEAYRKQKSRIVSDTNLREEIKSSIAKSLVPVYREFYQAHRIPVGLEVMARFAPDDVEDYISNLFFTPTESESVQCSLMTVSSYENETNSLTSH